MGNPTFGFQNGEVSWKSTSGDPDGVAFFGPTIYTGPANGWQWKILNWLPYNQGGLDGRGFSFEWSIINAVALQAMKWKIFNGITDKAFTWKIWEGPVLNSIWQIIGDAATVVLQTVSARSKTTSFTANEVDSDFEALDTTTDQ
jgi:hypothetical protein